MTGSAPSAPPPPSATHALRRVVLAVAALNGAYFVVEIIAAVSLRSVALFADSVDFLQDAAINLLIAVALGWSLLARARLGRVLALIILVPAVFAAIEAVRKAFAPEAPAAIPLIVIAAIGGLINLLCAVLLARHKGAGGSLTGAAWLIARNDVIVNVAIVGMGLLTLAWVSGWPDIVLGVLILLLNATAARTVWRAAGDESLAARHIASGDAVPPTAGREGGDD